MLSRGSAVADALIVVMAMVKVVVEEERRDTC